MTGTLFVNGKWPGADAVTSGRREGAAFYTEHGKIRAVGASSELKLQLAGREYRTVDWDGGYVLPGLADSHMHLSLHGLKLGMLDFSGVPSKQDMLRLVRKKAADTPAGEWILGMNWNENELAAATVPSLEELDEAGGGRPVFLTRVCHHAYLANTAAFERAGVTARTPDPKDGAYGRDRAGRLNGWVYENASAPLFAAQPEMGYTDKKACIRRACLDALRLGLTAVHTDDLRMLGGVETMLRIHRELWEEAVCLRTHQLIDAAHLDELAQLGLSAGSGDDRLRIGAVKIFADGAFGGRTALLSEPYHDAPGTRGMAIHTQEELDALVGLARSHSMPVAVHAIGDAGAEMTIRAMESHPLPQSTPCPDRLIHATLLRGDLVDRLRRLPVALDIQPRFVAADFPWVLERVGERRRDYLYAWKTLLKAGLPCAGGSDAPIEPLNPFWGIHSAVTRRKPGEQHEGYLPSQKLTVQEAVQLFTTGSARIAGEEHARGRVEHGYGADFTVIDRDPYTVTADEMLETRVLMTVVNGEIAYTH